MLSHGWEGQLGDDPTEQPSFTGRGPPYRWLRTTLRKALKIIAVTLGLTRVERKL